MNRRIALALASLPLALMLPLAAQAQSACTAYPQGAASYDCTCTGSEGGSVWGTDIYTSDSSICVAARHAGVIGPAGGTVRAMAEPGQSGYSGSSRNGVNTSNWGGYQSSFRVVPVSIAACGRYPSGAASYSCGCSGSESGSVWGSGPYTSDSNICVAARHAGAVGPAGGEVHVLGMGGLPGYVGSARNGVTTSNWGSYQSSFVFNFNH